MFSKIGETTGPLIVGKAGDGRERQNKNPQQGKGKDAPSAGQEDTTFLSTQVLRLMLGQEDPSAPETVAALTKLADLEKHEVKEIPVRPGQSVFSALDDATA